MRLVAVELWHSAGAVPKELAGRAGRADGVLRAALLLTLLAVAGCGADSGETVESAGLAEQYANPLDGISIEYPAAWHRAEEPLARFGSEVEVLGLATVPPREGVTGCSPYPWTTMKSLGEDDLVLTVRVGGGAWIDEGLPKPGARPADLLRLPEMPPSDLPGGCSVDGVLQRSAQFLEHERAYTVFVATRGDLSDERSAELDEVWSSLRISQVVEPKGDAAVGQQYWHVLYTHCGIRDTVFNGRGWVADPPLVEGVAGPPDGWRNPQEAGFMTLLAADRAEFTSRNGEGTASFRPRTEDDPATPPCA